MLNHLPEMIQAGALVPVSVAQAGPARLQVMLILRVQTWLFQYQGEAEQVPTRTVTFQALPVAPW